MSINKNAYLRYQVLDKCFSNKYRLYFIEDSLEQVNVALEDFNGQGSKIEKRQLFDDIKFMESEAGWSISLERIKQRKKVYYRYGDQHFSIKNQKISDEELDAINSSLMVLQRFRGLPQSSCGVMNLNSSSVFQFGFNAGLTVLWPEIPHEA